MIKTERGHLLFIKDASVYDTLIVMHPTNCNASVYDTLIVMHPTNCDASVYDTLIVRESLALPDEFWKKLFLIFDLS